MSDMRSVIAPKADELTADDLLSGPITIEITDVQVRPGTERPVTIAYSNDNGKPFKPCKSVSRVLVAGWGPDSAKYVGKRLTLHRDPTVKWGGMEVGGIRVAAMSGIDKPLVMALTATKGSKKMTTVQPLKLDTMRQSIGIDVAADRIANAATVDELRAVWTSVDLKPYQKQLKGALDERKAELTPNDGTLTPENPSATEGRADADMGERDDDFDDGERGA